MQRKTYERTLDEYIGCFECYLDDDGNILGLDLYWYKDSLANKPSKIVLDYTKIDKTLLEKILSQKSEVLK